MGTRTTRFVACCRPSNDFEASISHERSCAPGTPIGARNGGSTSSRATRHTASRKSLLLGPERLALLLLKDGWTIRNKIVWAKTNTVPSSVQDRLTATHEVIYLLSRTPRYYFDLDEIRQPHLSRPPKHARSTTARPERAGRGPNTHSDRGLAAMRASGRVGHPLGKNPGDVWSMSVSRSRSAHIAAVDSLR